MKSLLKMRGTTDNYPDTAIVHGTGGTAKNSLADTSHHTFETVQNYHINGLGWENIGYHYYIEKDGTLRKGRPENYHGAHCRGKNKSSIGICLAGNFSATLPTKAQKETLKELLTDIIKRYSNIIIKPHRAFSNTECYGLKLSDTWAFDLVKKIEGLAKYSIADLFREILKRLNIKL